MEIFKYRISRELGKTFVHNFDQDMITRLMDGRMCHEMFLEKDSTNNIKFSRHFLESKGGAVKRKLMIDTSI